MIFEKFAKLRELYPDEIKQIEAEEDRVKALLKRQEYSQLETTRELVALCRKDIVAARLKLATDRALNDDGRRELWMLIDARSWFLDMVARDYETELASIEQDLERDLA